MKGVEEVAEGEEVVLVWGPEQKQPTPNEYHLQAIPKVTCKTGSVGMCRQDCKWGKVISGENQNEKGPQKPYRLRGGGHFRNRWRNP